MSGLLRCQTVGGRMRHRQQRAALGWLALAPPTGTGQSSSATPRPRPLSVRSPTRSSRQQASTRTSIKSTSSATDKLNSFVAGGQNLFLNTGLIVGAKTPDQLAGVIAHETGHIAGGHLSRMPAARAGRW